MNDSAEERRWYALKIFRNRTAAVRAEIEQAGFRCFVPTRPIDRVVGDRTVTVDEPVIPSLLFVRADKTYVERLHGNPTNRLRVYCRPGTSEPAEISDREMEIFIFVTTRGMQQIKAVDPSLAKGDRIRVTDGIFKGAEGYIVRVRNAKRLIVVIEGVVAVATTYIPKNYIEKIDPATVPGENPNPASGEPDDPKKSNLPSDV